MLSAEIRNEAIPCASEDTFYPAGYMWPQNSELTIHYRNETPDAELAALSAEDVRQSVHRAYLSWAETTCGNDGKANITVKYAQDFYTKNDLGEVKNEEGNYLSFTNVVGWDATGTLPGLGTGTLAYAETLYISSTGFPVSGDIIFNDHLYQWRAHTHDTGEVAGCSVGAPDCYNIESVALHEVGHIYGMGHLDCVESIMFPKSFAGLDTAQLSSHETAGICTLYPPAQNQRGALCSQDSQCEPDYQCIIPTTSATRGFCLKACTNEATCEVGFTCATDTVMVGEQAQQRSYCKPGLSAAEEPIDDGGLCLPCSSGDECPTGICTDDGQGGEPMCTKTCQSSEDCPSTFNCSPTQSDISVCWPLDINACGQDPRKDLNEQCYKSDVANGTTTFHPCGTNLFCFGFITKCTGQTGHCVRYCNETSACPEPNLDCCAMVDDQGNCITPAETDTTNIGGCFDLRQPGQSCSTAEESICRDGNVCLNFGIDGAKCYSSCNTADTCTAEQSCQSITDDDCGDALNVCCGNAGLTETPAVCDAPISVAELDLGAACATDYDCNSRVCFHFEDESACSRSCDPLTGFSCPTGAYDVNADGTTDVTFNCLKTSNTDGMCWPNEGPFKPQINPEQPTPKPSGGCCNTNHQTLHAQLPNLLFWLPFLWFWSRKRLRATKLNLR